MSDFIANTSPPCQWDNGSLLNLILDPQEVARDPGFPCATTEHSIKCPDTEMAPADQFSSSAMFMQPDFMTPLSINVSQPGSPFAGSTSDPLTSYQPSTPGSINSYVSDTLPDLETSIPILPHMTEDLPDLGPIDLDPSSMVKETLRNKIKKRCSDTNYDILTIEDKPKVNKLTPMDEERKKRRRESNRRAAAKSRNKKKAATDNLSKELVRLEDENGDLRSQVSMLEEDLNNLNKVLQEHLQVCPLHQPQLGQQPQGPAPLHTPSTPASTVLPQDLQDLLCM